ncbi:MAG: PRC-barrel domain-containing protein [Chloroflexi bacterium]|nr:PRC-barrel domain-containing protein [Chloroflexota bacterium]
MDKKAREIIGKPVVTFNRGSKIYDIEDMVIDPERRQVLALVVQEKAIFHSALAIPFGRVSAIGPDAVIIPDAKAVIEIDRDPVLKRLYNDQVVRGLRVLTDDGRKLGEVTDMLIDDKTGEIKGYYVSMGRLASVGQGLRWLPVESVLSVGMRVLYVQAAVADELDQQAGGFASALDQTGDKLRTAGARANDQLGQLGDQLREALPQRAGGLVVGKTAHTTVTAPDGTVIAQKGALITQDNVDAAKSSNRMTQLLMSAGSGPAQQHAGSLNEQASQSINDIRLEAKQLWNQITGGYTQTVDSTDDKLMQRRVKYAIGRPVNRVILDSNDDVILNTGDIITNRAVQAAREAGVLDVLVDSVYTERPKLDIMNLKAPKPGEASLEKKALVQDDTATT